MKWPNYIRLVPVIAILFLMQCKTQEKVAEQPPIADSPCVQLTHDLPDNDFAFVAEAESDSEEIASQKARKQTVIELVQFFQSEFIDGSQEKIFGSSGHLRGWDEFRKQWAETSFEIIGALHNRQAFTHNQIVTQDNGTFRAVNMLTVSHNWIQNHWEKTLKATDPAVYNSVTQKDINSVWDFERQEIHSCVNNS